MRGRDLKETKVKKNKVQKYEIRNIEAEKSVTNKMRQRRVIVLKTITKYCKLPIFFM